MAETDKVRKKRDKVEKKRKKGENGNTTEKSKSSKKQHVASAACSLLEDDERVDPALSSLFAAKVSSISVHGEQRFL